MHVESRQGQLSQDEAVALVRYLLESSLVELDEETGEPVLGKEHT